MATDFDGTYQGSDIIDLGLDDDKLTAWDGERSQPPIPGEYEFEIRDARTEQSKKGKPTLVVDFEVVSEGSEKGKTIRAWYSLDRNVDASRRRMKSLVVASGVQLAGGGFSREQLIGAHLMASVKQEEYEDLDRESGKPVKRMSNKVLGEKPVTAQKVAPVARPANAPRMVGRGRPA